VSTPSTVPKILFALGTRPEAIKLAPVIRAAQAYDDWRVVVCNTGQHVELLRPVLQALELTPDITLDTMRAGQGLAAQVGAGLDRFDEVLARERPDRVVVQGDTTTTLTAALAAFYRGIAIDHVEAGLRTNDLRSPFPEEMNRVLVTRLSDLHLAPTPRAKAALLREGVSEQNVEVTGNTVVDAVKAALGRLERLEGHQGPPNDVRELAELAPERPVVFVTGHRRESFRGGLEAICDGIDRLAKWHPEIEIVYPVHLNPNVQQAVRTRLLGRSNVRLMSPVGYLGAIWLLRRAKFVITDSGGLQEEAPELAKPALVTRAVTERPEALEAGYAVLVGYDVDALVETAHTWLVDPEAYARVVPKHNPYGDGRAGLRCVSAIRRRLDLTYETEATWR